MDDSAHIGLTARLAVFRGHIDAFHDYLAAVGVCGNDLAFFALIPAGEDDDNVVLFNMQRIHVFHGAPSEGGGSFSPFR